jgi:hypothetical protein
MASVEFHGGPADGRTLKFQRVPLWLRVVAMLPGEDGKDLDVLDQLDDEPREGEVVHVYERISYGFACRGGPGEFAVYEYREDIDGQELRDTAAWRAKVEELTGEEIDADGSPVTARG